VGRPGPDPRADSLEAIRARLDLVGGRVQGMVQELAEVLSWRRCAIAAGSGH